MFNTSLKTNEYYKIIIVSSLKKININQSLINIYLELFDLIDMIILNSKTPLKFATFRKIKLMIFDSINNINLTNNIIDYNDLLCSINFDYIRSVFLSLNVTEMNYGIKIIDKIQNYNNLIIEI